MKIKILIGIALVLVLANSIMLSKLNQYRSEVFKTHAYYYNSCIEEATKLGLMKNDHDIMGYYNCATMAANACQFRGCRNENGN